MLSPWHIFATRPLKSLYHYQSNPSINLSFFLLSTVSPLYYAVLYNTCFAVHFLYSLMISNDCFVFLFFFFIRERLIRAAEKSEENKERLFNTRRTVESVRPPFILHNFRPLFSLLMLLTNISPLFSSACMDRLSMWLASYWRSCTNKGLVWR